MGKGVLVVLRTVSVAVLKEKVSWFSEAREYLSYSSEGEGILAVRSQGILQLERERYPGSQKLRTSSVTGW